MNNDPELSGKYLGTITSDFIKVADVLKDASYQLRRRGLSDYPIFVISKSSVHVGQLLLGKAEVDNNNWNYNFSFLDEFIQRGLVAEDKVEDFKVAYKNPDEFCCLFVVDIEFTNFVFIPYPEEDNNNSSVLE